MKVYGSTGGGDDVTGEQTVSFEEMKAIIDTAHSAGHKVAIHSYGPNGARDAIRAGTDTLEHATDLDDATIAELVRKKIWYVPTINHNRTMSTARTMRTNSLPKRNKISAIISSAIS